MTRNAWYLGCGPEDVGDAAILVGDRARVELVAEQLHSPRWLNENRGLATVTGTHAGQQITASAFGMGAPIAAVVLHELYGLGVRTFLRLGTVMSLDADRLGGLVLADAAVRGESTSATYVPPGFPAAADHDLCARLRAELTAVTRPWTAGVVASYDGFYTEMFPLADRWKERIDELRHQLRAAGVLAVDMETATVLTVGRALGCKAAALCLVTVAGPSGQRLEEADRQSAERELVAIGLRALTE